MPWAAGLGWAGPAGEATRLPQLPRPHLRCEAPGSCWSLEPSALLSKQKPAPPGTARQPPASAINGTFIEHVPLPNSASASVPTRSSQKPKM